MNIQKLNSDGLVMRFKVKGEHVIFLDADGNDKATRPATPIELLLWGELKATVESAEKDRKNLQTAETSLHELEKKIGRIVKALEATPAIKWNPDDVLGSVADVVRVFGPLIPLWGQVGEYVERHFPAELAEHRNSVANTVIALLGPKTAGTARAERQRGGMATREAQPPFERREPTVLGGTDRV